MVTWRDGDGLAVKRRFSRQVVRLNESGEMIWSLCDGYMSVAAIVEVLERRFQDRQPAIRRDVTETLAYLEAKGLLTFKAAPRKLKGTKELDLKDIPFYVINCASDGAKRDHMRRQLSDLGLRFEFIDGVECEPGVLGTALSHLRVLNRKAIRAPFGVLEDDCLFNENFRYRFTLPKNADAFYLGVSRFGIETPGQLSWGKFDRVQWSRYDDHNLRVFNMLASHAIVYLNEAFRQTALRAMLAALTHPEHYFPCDVGLASIQKSHLVLTPNKPICHQSAAFGGQQGSTDKALTEL